VGASLARVNLDCAVIDDDTFIVLSDKWRVRGCIVVRA
jgi:hypothetical protein